jgi:tyrosine aminotransferase
LIDCIRLAGKYSLPIIADEIYEDIVFGENKYIPIASLTNELLVVTCSGLAKRYMLPGWRVGWLLVHDPRRAAGRLKRAIFDLAGLILGPCTLIQAALPDIFGNVPEDFNQLINRTLEENARVFVEQLGKGTVIAPQGTLYMMLRLPDGTDDVVWCQQLLAEENVSVLPGTVHGSLFYIPRSSESQAMQD